MGTFARLDVPVVFGSLRDRWFAVVKPPGLVAPASPPRPSVEATLSPFCGGRELSFPIRPEKDAQGLLIVAADDAMRRCFDDLVRQRLVRSTYRVLADVTIPPVGTTPPEGLPFVGCHYLAARCMLGSLWDTTKADTSRSLLKRGVLRSELSARPLRLRAKPLRDHKPRDSSCIAWESHRALRDALAGESVPHNFAGQLSKSLLSHSRSPQSSLGRAQIAATEFELQTEPKQNPQDPTTHTAIYVARPLTSASHQVRAHFAGAGAPVLFDAYYHHYYNEEVRRRAFTGDRSTSKEMPLHFPPLQPRGQLGLQLCALELPDPLQPRRRLRISLRHPPSEWDEIHPGASDATFVGYS